MVCKVCQVQPDLLETKVHQETMEIMANQVNKDPVDLLVMMAILDLLV